MEKLNIQTKPAEPKSIFIQRNAQSKSVARARCFLCMCLKSDFLSNLALHGQDTDAIFCVCFRKRELGTTAVHKNVNGSQEYAFETFCL